MSKLFIFAVMGILLICTLPVYGTSIHDNYVYFTNVAGFDFRMIDHSITDGQPWGGIRTSSGGDGGEILVSAGRHGSEGVARWFKDRADMALDTRHAAGAADWPDKLNFAIYGDMELWGDNGGSALCKDIVIGQGHVGAYNNWWIGGRNTNMYELNGNVWLECPAVEGHCGGVVLLSTHDSDTFPLSVRACPPAQSDEPIDQPLHESGCFISVIFNK